jgi:prepilin signal peptidase PulO-like enzyme (type II secretory pathway)
LVLPVFPIALTAQGIAIALGADWASLGIALAVSVAMFIAGLLANYFEWLGMGDVKLASAITLILAFFSPLASVVAIGLAFVLAFAVIIFKLVRGKANLGQSIPLGPYMLLSFLIALSQSVVTSLA